VLEEKYSIFWKETTTTTTTTKEYPGRSPLPSFTTFNAIIDLTSY
jgi:hypothetical protein